MANAADTAASFGYSLAFFNSDPDLKALLDRATAQNYTSERFVAELQNTNWFRTRSESYRKFVALATTDPQTLASMQNQMAARVNLLSAQTGAYVTPEEHHNFVDAAIALGWSDDTIREQLVQRLRIENGHYRGGQAAAAEQAVRQTLGDYGVNLDDASIGWYVQNIVRGASADSTIKSWAMQQAASRYPALADRIWAGENVRQIASPYIQSYGKLLEVSPDTVSIEDPLIQQALTSKDKEGKPAAKTVWQFEQDLRNDSRWIRTQNAQDSMMTAAKKVLGDFGLVGV